jgi:ADP-heptose:LPS heptosyltransferase
LLETLHAQFKETRISILVRKGNESIYANHPFLKEVLIWNKQEHKIKNLFGLLKTIRTNKYDMVINCHRYASSGFLAGFSGARHIAGFKQNPFSFLFNFTVKHIIGNGSHEVERYHQLISDISTVKTNKPKLYPSAQDEEKVKIYKNEPYVCFAPASVWFTKQLPESKWIELGKKNSSVHTIYLLGAPNDKALCERIKKALPEKRIINLAGTLNLLQSCALMQKSQMNYVNDSAPLHLASAVNAPVTAFFCSTVPSFGFTPLSDKSTILEVQNLDCRPCGLHGYKQCPKGHFKCGNDISLNSIEL